VIELVGVGLLIAVIGFLLRELGFRGAPLIGVLGIVLLFIYTLQRLGEVVSLLGGVVSATGISELARAALKVVGVSYIAGVCAELCRQVGEGGMARVIEGVGRVEILLLSVPYIIKIVELVTKEGAM
jgi:stage III sporulation protein AD